MPHLLITACRLAAAMLLTISVTAPSPAASASAPAAPIPRTVIVKSEPVASEAALIEQADRIVYGWFDSADREQDTGQRVASGKLVNYTQTFHVRQSLKGQSSQLIRVLSTGIEPLPDAKDPLNRIYPGPMVEGSYVCFLKKLPRQDSFAIIGGWQGVYPVEDGRTIALADAGFPQLGGLTVDQLAARVNH